MLYLTVVSVLSALTVERRKISNSVVLGGLEGLRSSSFSGGFWHIYSL